MEVKEVNPPIRTDVKDQLITDITKYALATFERNIPYYADGLKPVVRRILYIADQNKVYRFMKVSKLTGLVIGLHPHGEGSINKAIVSLAQEDFKLNIPLFVPGGSFGDISDKKNASPRYIETKLSEFSKDNFLSLFDRNSTPFIQSTADMTVYEPVFFPSLLPAVLINGAMGIAESFTCDIPPHNINDVADMAEKYIRNKDISPKLLTEGLYPDYITGGTILNGAEISKYYYDPELTKGGTITIRGDAEIDQKNNMIYVRSLPHDNDYTQFQNKILHIGRERDKKGNPKNIPISNIVDFGERVDYKDGPKYVFIKCRKGVNLVEVLDHLYKYTCLEENKKINFTMNYGEKIKRCTVKDIYKDWYRENKMVIHKRTNVEIQRINKRISINEGYIKIFPVKDKVSAFISKLSGKTDANIEKLRKAFGLNSTQAKEIYDMPYHRLTKSYEKQLRETNKNLHVKVKELINNLDHIDDIMIANIKFMKNKYGYKRKTKVIQSFESSKKIVFSNGFILASRNSVGIFDPTNVISGQKIMNGLKSVKIDDKWVRGIVSSHSITNIVKSIIVFYDNGTARNIVPHIPNSWINVANDNGFITCVVPIYDDQSGDIFCINDSGKIKFIDPSTIGNRNVHVGNISKALFIPKTERDSYLLLIGSDCRYQTFKCSEVPDVGRGASGVKSGFNNNDVSVVLMDPKFDSVLVMLEGLIESNKDGYVYPIPYTSFERMNRTRKPIKLDIDGYKVTGLGVIDSSNRHQLSIFVSSNSTFGLQYKNFKTTQIPRKIAFASFDVLSIDQSS